jgi:hypothetical protein
MAKARKTVEVQELKRWANSILSTPEGEIEYITRDFKDGICVMIEKVLHEAGAYNGYMFLNNEDSEYQSYGYLTRQYI